MQVTRDGTGEPPHVNPPGDGGGGGVGAEPTINVASFDVCAGARARTPKVEESSTSASLSGSRATSIGPLRPTSLNQALHASRYKPSAETSCERTSSL